MQMRAAPSEEGISSAREKREGAREGGRKAGKEAGKDRVLGRGRGGRRAGHADELISPCLF